MSITIRCLKSTAISGNQAYPIFIGFAPASDVLQLAETPSFSPGTPNDQISTNILTPPVRDWQRPLNTDRTATIAAIYNNSGEVMPNPVLLCENATSQSVAINIAQQITTGNIPTQIWEVTIQKPAAGGQKPLWILDGQHRINGLAASPQSTNPIPLVLLLNQGGQAYAPSTVAKLFAQVTTEASPLDDLHHDWLTFAFRLRDYSTTSPTASEHRQSMEAVAELCRSPELPTPGTPNPFHNRIKFNPKAPKIGPVGGGFQYTCSELKSLFLDGYYSISAQVPHIAPKDLAAQIASAYLALTKKVAAPHPNTVFFGTSDGQVIMQDAFLKACLTKIARSGPQTDQQWEQLLDALQFPATNWKFDWVTSLNGTNASISKAIATRVLAEAFTSAVLPATTGTIADFLKGNEAKVSIEYSRMNANGRVIQSGRQRQVVTAGNILTHTIAPAKHFRIISKSSNIGKIEIIDTSYPSTDPVYYKERGENLDNPSSQKQCSNPLKLVFRCHYYGGTKSDIQLDVRW